MPAQHPPSAAAPAPATDPVEARARALIAELAAGRWDHPDTAFDATMAAGLPPARLRDLWGSLEAAAGAFTRIEQVELGRAGAQRSANVTCAFQRLRKVVRVVFDG